MPYCIYTVFMQFIVSFMFLMSAIRIIWS